MKRPNPELVQSKLLPLFIKYLEQHFPNRQDLLEQNKIKQILKGVCLGFANTLAKGCSDFTIFSQIELLEKLLSWEPLFLQGKRVPRDPHLDSLILSIIENKVLVQSNMMAGAFDEKGLKKTWGLLEKEGDFLIICSNYADSNLQDYAHAISIVKVYRSPDRYYLIDANCPGLITLVDDPINGDQKILNFIQKSFNNDESLFYSLHFFSFTAPIKIDKLEFYLNHLDVEKHKKIKDKVKWTLNNYGVKPDEFNSVMERPSSVTDKIFKSGEELIKLVVESKDAKNLTCFIETQKDRSDFDKIINYKNSHGNTALIQAIKTGNLKFVELLCEAGANLKISDNNFNTPILLAEAQNNQAIIQCLKLREPESRDFKNDLTLLRDFSHFLETDFSILKSDNTAEIFRSRIFEFSLHLMDCGYSGPLFVPELSDDIKKIVTACKFMHHNPKNRFLSRDPQYPVSPEEGAQLAGSLKYGTQQGTFLFYQICTAFKLGEEKYQSTVKNLLPLHNNLNSPGKFGGSPFVNFIYAFKNVLNLDSKNPHPAEKFAQKILSLMCSDEKKLPPRLQTSLMDEAIAQLDLIADIKNISVLEKIKAMLAIRDLVMESSLFNIRWSQDNSGFLSNYFYYSKDKFGVEIKVSAQFKKLENIGVEHIAEQFSQLTVSDKSDFILNHWAYRYCWILEKETFVNPSKDLIAMTEEIIKLLPAPWLDPDL